MRFVRVRIVRFQEQPSSHSLHLVSRLKLASQSAQCRSYFRLFDVEMLWVSPTWCQSIEALCEVEKLCGMRNGMPIGKIPFRCRRNGGRNSAAADAPSRRGITISAIGIFRNIPLHSDIPFSVQSHSAPSQAPAMMPAGGDFRALLNCFRIRSARFFGSDTPVT